MEPLKNLSLWSKAKRLSYVVEQQVPFLHGGLQRHSDGGLFITSGELSAEASRFHKYLYDLEIVSPNNVPKGDYVADLKADVSTMSSRDVLQLITWVCRADRFAEGWLVDGFNSRILTRGLRRIYRLTVCDEDGWPYLFVDKTEKTVAEGLPVFSLDGTIEGRTTGSRRRCSAKSCPGWFIGVLWETGQQMYICSEGWHYDPKKRRIDVVGGGTISARFVSPKPLGVPPLPEAEWPDRDSLLRRKGWRVGA